MVHFPLPICIEKRVNVDIAICVLDRSDDAALFLECELRIDRQTERARSKMACDGQTSYSQAGKFSVIYWLIWKREGVIVFALDVRLLQALHDFGQHLRSFNFNGKFIVHMVSAFNCFEGPQGK